MPYIQKTVRAGKTIEIFKYYSHKCKAKGAVRKRNQFSTNEAVAKVNQRNAENHLRWKINTNFGEGDIYITLTYAREKRKTPVGAKQELSLFLRRVRRLYKKFSLEFKYIAVTEYENTAIHHHLIIGKGVETQAIVKLWTNGRPSVKYLDATGDYSNLASYLIKETSKTFKTTHSASGVRYSCSRNLKEPDIDEKIIKHDSWREDPKPYKGYYILSEPEIGFHEITGYGFMHYTMVSLE